MLLSAQQVDEKQNSLPPTDFAAFDQQAMDKSNWDANRFAMDNRLHVRFFMKARLNHAKSVEANRAIYEDTEYVEIMVPGDKHNIVVEPVWEQTLVRFPQQYARFKAGLKEQVIGTPLKLLPFLTESQVAELEYLKVVTVEQLANLNDTVQFMGIQDLKQRAKKWLDTQHSGESLYEENKSLKERLARLEAMMEQQAKPAVAAKK